MVFKSTYVQDAMVFMTFELTVLVKRLTSNES